MTIDELRQDADRREASVRAALAEIERRHGNQGRLRIETSPADMLDQVERDRLLADCVEYLDATERHVRKSVTIGELLRRFAVLESK